MNKRLLLMIRSDRDVARACREVEQFLTFERMRIVSKQEIQGPQLIGIWIDSLMIDPTLERFDDVLAFEDRALGMRESISYSGIWCLRWLDIGLDQEPADLCALRKLLLSKLIKNRSLYRQILKPMFTPIFSSDEGLPVIRLQTDQLKELFPGVVSEPILWNINIGTLEPLQHGGNDQLS